jgi:positive regulator of sigma E activity
LIEEYGVVTRVSDYGTDVQITMPGACDHCSIREACHAAGQVVTVPDQQSLKPQQVVRLRITNASILQATLVVYGIPFAAMLIGLFGTYFSIFAHHGEDSRVLFSFAVGTALLVASGFLVAYLDKRIERRFRYLLEPVAQIPEY